MTSPRADVLVKEGAVEAVEFLGQGAGGRSIVCSVSFQLFAPFKSFECCEAIPPPPLHPAGLLFDPLVLSFPNPTSISFPSQSPKLERGS